MEFYTLEEVAKLLRVSNMTIYRYIKSGKLPAYKLEQRIRIKKSDFETFIENSKFTSTSKTDE